MDEFLNYIKPFIGQYGSLNNIIRDSTDEIMNLRKLNSPLFKEIKPNKILLGNQVPLKFYLVRYYYNGNQVWCPVMSLAYKVIHNKNILYILNLQYLPFIYKIKFFNMIYNQQKPIFDYNDVLNNVLKERTFKNLNFEKIYKQLKKDRFEFAISALDLLKIKNVYSVSTKLLPRFIFLDLKRINSNVMKELYTKLASSKEKDQLAEIIEQWDKLIEEYKEDTEEYYKKLRTFEKNLKLFED
jgi:hypothetical protein